MARKTNHATQPVAMALAAIALCPSASATTLTGMPFSTWRQYQILLLRGYCSARSPRTASTFGPHPKCFKSHAATAGGRFGVISLSFQFRQTFPQAEQRSTRIANFTQTSAGDTEIPLGSAATLWSGISEA